MTVTHPTPIWRITCSLCDIKSLGFSRSLSIRKKPGLQTTS